MSLPRWPLVSVLGLLVLVTSLAYSNTFHSPFIFDDLLTVINFQKANYLYVANLFGTRGVSVMVLALLYHWFDANVVPFHIAALVVHILTTWVVFGLAYLLAQVGVRPSPRPVYKQKPFWIAVFVALIFALHPLQTSAVTYTAQMRATLAALFSFLALFLYAKGRTSSRPAWLFVGSFLSIFVAMHCKEITIILPVVIVLMEYVFFSSTWATFKKQIPRLSLFLLTLLIIPATLFKLQPFVDFNPFVSGSFSHRFAGLPVASGVAQETSSLSRYEYLLTQTHVITTYLRLLVWPVGQQLDYDYPITHSFWTWPTPLTSLFLLGLLGFGIWAIKKRWKLVGFGIVFFFLALSVESSIIPIRDVIFEHRMYIPLFGCALAVVGGASLLADALQRSWHSATRVFLSGGLIVVCMLGLLAYSRNQVWASDVTLWQDNIAKAPHKARPHNNLGVALANAGQTEQAIEQYQIAAQLDPTYADPHTNLGGVYGEEGQIDKAIIELKHALKLDPTLTTAYNNLGSAYSNKGETDQAIEQYQAALKIDPTYTEVWANLGRVYVKVGRLKDAIDVFKKALSLDPKNAYFLTDLGAAYFKLGETGFAQQEFEKAVQIDPTYSLAQQNLARLNELLYGGVK